jgi:amidase
LPVAKSNVPEWAGGHTFNPVYGITRNPFNKNKIAGGSSGGSSVALATKQVWLATGNDLGGSLRTPASFNNIVGLRPSIGVVPRSLRYNRFDPLWVEGPLARCVKDIGLMLDAMSGYCKTDPLSFDHKCSSFLEAVDGFELPAKVAVTEDLGLVPVEQEVRGVFRTVVPHLKTIGLEVGSDIPDFTGAIESFHTLRGLLMAYMLGDLYKSKKDEILVDIVKNIEVGFKVSNEEIITAEKIRQDLFIKVDKFFEEYDFLICPTCSVLPFDIETPFVKEIDGVACKTYIDWFAITFALTLTSCPIISLPVGFSSTGLPVGIQIMSKPRQEDKLLAFAKVIEEKVSVNKSSPI